MSAVCKAGRMKGKKDRGVVVEGCYANRSGSSFVFPRTRGDGVSFLYNLDVDNGISA